MLQFPHCQWKRVADGRARAGARRCPHGARSGMALIALAGFLCLAISLPAYASSRPPEGDVVPGSPHLVEGDARAEALTSETASEIVEYTVQEGDTLYGIAARHNLAVQTLIWANDLESHPGALRIGQLLLVPPVDGVLYVVQPGDTLLGIVSRYGSTVEAVGSLPANHLTGPDALLQPGERLLVPGGVKPAPTPKPAPPPPPPAPTPVPAGDSAPPPAPAGDSASSAAAPQPASPPADGVPSGAATGHFIWPVTGFVSQGNGPGHHALDILAPKGTPIKAADSGRVTYTGWSDDGYGYHVVIDHGNGYCTRYAHMSRIDVQVGQVVQQGETIGAVGATGRASAFHLHFEIEQGGVRINPAPLLP
jgi:murein DD-endopeptidase MepM/ murein hydrolase activator NlpD